MHTARLTTATFNLTCAVAALFLATAPNASAALINNGTYTTDDVNGLDWLDIDQTRRMSGAQLATALGSSLSGWTLATRGQVATLWTQAGVTDTNRFLGGSQFTAVDSLLALIAGSLNVGTTGNWYDGIRLQGLTQEAAFSGYNWAPAININRSNSTAWAYSYHYQPGPTAYPTTSADWGYWLVRNSTPVTVTAAAAALPKTVTAAATAVPEPGSLSLVGLALAGLVLRRHRRG